jgi:hypothetical protein
VKLNKPLSYEEISEDGELCKYCPWPKESHYPGLMCEGSNCEDAYDNYLDEFKEEI